MQVHTPEDKHLWVDTWGYGGHIRGNHNAAQVNNAGFGLALGADYSFSQNLMAGAFFGYEDKRVRNGNNRQSRSDVDAYSVGAYAAGNAGAFTLRGGVAYSRLDIDTRPRLP